MWESAEFFSLTPLEQEWLTDELSLTKKLIALSKNNFSVNIYQEFFTDTPDETFSGTGLTFEKESFFIREVTLCGNNTPWVFARSIIPQSTLDQHPPLLNLGNTSLGSYLFGHSQLHRENIKIALLDHNNVMYQRASLATNQLNLPPLWARCATFWLDDRPLLVAEVFLPAFWELW